MTYRIIAAKTGYTLANEGGDLARDTQGQVYIAPTEGEARAARDYLNQPRQGIEPRKGSPKLKSIFGKF